MPGLKFNKLYTVNRWNKPLFSDYKFEYKSPYAFDSYMTQDPSTFWGVDSTMEKQTTTEEDNDSAGGGTWGMFAGSIPSSPMTIDGKIYKRGAFDYADPLYHLAGNNTTGVGEVASDVGVGLFKSGAQSGNTGLMMAGAIAKGVGSGINALWGTGIDTKKDASNKAGIAAYNSYSNANSTDAMQSITAQANYQNAHTGGVFKKRQARNANALDKMRFGDAKSFAFRSQKNNAYNIGQDQISSGLATYSAFGGPLNMINNDNMGAIEYGLAADYIAAKNRKNEIDDKMPGMVGLPALNTFSEGGGIHINPKNRGKFNATKKRTGKTTEELTHSKNPLTRKRAIFAQNAKKWKHALGGDLQTHGSDWGDGMITIGAGLSHELNPNEGVQMGTDSQGTPNLVEEGEVVWNDYVFSNRIPVDEGTKAKFHIGKKKEMTYADLAKKLEKEITERPNDPISKAGFNAQMEQLEAEQERQKQEMEAERAREAFEAMSPEEQTALMQQVAQAQQQEAVVQEQAMQEQAMAEQGMVPEETVAPEEAAMVSQEEMPVDGEEGVPVEGEEMAEGGKIYKSGGNFEDWWNLYVDDPAKKANIRDTINGVDMQKIYEAVTGEKAPEVENIYLYDALKNLYDTDDTQFRPFDLSTYTMEKETAPTRTELATAAINTQPETNSTEETKPVKMRNSAASRLRYVPILGGAIGLGYDLLNRPDYSRAEAVINAARGITPTMIQPNYIGDYLTYRPMDIWAEQNRLDANARATDRAIRNSGLPTATKNASLLANAYNNQIASSELYKKALEYNDAKEAQVKGFNRGTNQYNSQVGMTAQQANQQAALAAGRYGLQGIITGNQMKDAIDAQRGASISANLGNLLQSIGNLGEEAYDKDRLQYLIDSGVLHGQLHKAKYGGMLTKKSKKGGNC